MTRPPPATGAVFLFLLLRDAYRMLAGLWRLAYRALTGLFLDFDDSG
jgi:hypothetical protein